MFIFFARVLGPSGPTNLVSIVYYFILINRRKLYKYVAIYIIPVWWLPNRLISPGLKTVLGDTKNSCLLLYYRQFSTIIKIKIIKISPRAYKTCCIIFILNNRLSHTKKLCIASYYRQFSMIIKIKILKINASFVIIYYKQFFLFSFGVCYHLGY